MSLSESYLVIGGNGFLGSYIVKALRDRGEPLVSVLDIVQNETVEGVQQFLGDITDESSIERAIRECSATCVIHTASPIHGLAEELYYRVNLGGTKNVISSVLKCEVKKLVYTSSTGVVWFIQDLVGIDETYPLPPKGYDAYHDSKARAEELILEANGKNELRTVALRPCGMIGPGDRQVMHRLDTVYKSKQTHLQLGDNKNLVDWVYVGNVAKAHLLATDRLSREDVAGQVFFITNGEPIPSFDFSRAAWKELGDDLSRPVIKIPRMFAIYLAFFSELWCRIVGGKTEFTRFNVRYVTAAQWYNIDKARRVLGYEPDVTILDGIKLMVKWWKDEGAKR